MTIEKAIEMLNEIIDEGWLISDFDKCPAIDACEMAIEALEQEPRWIPTSERQPEENGNYLAFYRSSDGTATLEFMMVDHCNAGGGWLHEESGRKSYKKVIAWMPLPKAYSEGKE